MSRQRIQRSLPPNSTIQKYSNPSLTKQKKSANEESPTSLQIPMTQWSQAMQETQ
jgi:hypothetical protein